MLLSDLVGFGDGGSGVVFGFVFGLYRRSPHRLTNLVLAGDVSRQFRCGWDSHVSADLLLWGEGKRPPLDTQRGGGGATAGVKVRKWPWARLLR